MFKLLVILMLVVARHSGHADPVSSQGSVGASPDGCVDERPSAGPCPAGPDRIGEATAPPTTTLPGWPARQPSGPCPAGPQVPPAADALPVEMAVQAIAVWCDR
jgi:hypothetical protein